LKIEDVLITLSIAIEAEERMSAATGKPFRKSKVIEALDDIKKSLEEGDEGEPVLKPIRKPVKDKKEEAPRPVPHVIDFNFESNVKVPNDDWFDKVGERLEECPTAAEYLKKYGRNMGMSKRLALCAYTVGYGSSPQFSVDIYDSAGIPQPPAEWLATGMEDAQDVYNDIWECDGLVEGGEVARLFVMPIGYLAALRVETMTGVELAFWGLRDFSDMVVRGCLVWGGDGNIRIPSFEIWDAGWISAPGLFLNKPVGEIIAEKTGTRFEDKGPGAWSYFEVE